MTNRTSDVDLQNYLSNGEWELLDASLVREEITYSLSDEPFTHVTVSLKWVSPSLLSSSHSPSFQDTKEDSVLHVQHCLPLHDDVHPHGACLLYAPGLRSQDKSKWIWTHKWSFVGEKIALGVTVILAFSVFMLAIAERMPETSESIPLIGTVYCTHYTEYCNINYIQIPKILHHQTQLCRFGNIHWNDEWKGVQTSFY